MDYKSSPLGKDNRHTSLSNIRKFYWASFFGNWSFATGILIFHYRELGFTFFQIFLLAAIYEGLNFLLEIPTGILADMWGYKKTVVVGCLISALSFFVVLINSEIFASYVIWAILSAICTTLNSGTYDAFIYESVGANPTMNYSRVLGSIRFISFLTQAFCIIIGGFFSDLIGFNAALLLSGVGGLVQTAILLTMAEIERDKVEVINFKSNFSNVVSKIIISSVNEIRQSSKLKIIFFIGLLFFLNMQFVNTIFQPFLEGVGFRFNLIIAIFSAASMVLMAIGAKSVERISGEVQENSQILMVILLFCSLPLLFLFSKATGLIAFLLLFFVFGISEVLYMSVINRIIPSDIRATILSFQNQFFSLVYALAAIGIGWMLENIQMSYVSTLIGLSSILLTGLIFYSMRKQIKIIN